MASRNQFTPQKLKPPLLPNTPVKKFDMFASQQSSLIATPKALAGQIQRSASSQKLQSGAEASSSLRKTLKRTLSSITLESQQLDSIVVQALLLARKKFEQLMMFNAEFADKLILECGVLQLLQQAIESLSCGATNQHKQQYTHPQLMVEQHKFDMLNETLKQSELIRKSLAEQIEVLTKQQAEWQSQITQLQADLQKVNFEKHRLRECILKDDQFKSVRLTVDKIHQLVLLRNENDFTKEEHVLLTELFGPEFRSSEMFVTRPRTRSVNSERPPKARKDGDKDYLQIMQMQAHMLEQQFE